MKRDGLRLDLHRYKEKREIKKLLEAKEALTENTKNWESVQTFPPQRCACRHYILPPSFFITCVFSSPILPVLSTVSKIDWGLLVFWYMLVWLLECAHKVFVWAVKVSPECLLAFCWIFITYLMLFPPPECWTLLVIPPTLFFSFFLYLSSFSAFSTFPLRHFVCCILRCTLSVSHFVMPKSHWHVPLNTYMSEPVVTFWPYHEHPGSYGWILAVHC